MVDVVEGFPAPRAPVRPKSRSAPAHCPFVDDIAAVNLAIVAEASAESDREREGCGKPEPAGRPLFHDFQNGLPKNAPYMLSAEATRSCGQQARSGYNNTRDGLSPCIRGRRCLTPVTAKIKAAPLLACALAPSVERPRGSDVDIQAVPPQTPMRPDHPSSRRDHGASAQSRPFYRLWCRRHARRAVRNGRSPRPHGRAAAERISIPPPNSRRT